MSRLPLSPFFLLLAWMLAMPSPTRATEAQETALLQRLQAMSRALRAHSFRGVLVHVRDGEIDAIEVLHQGGEPEYERMLALTGEAREVIRTPEGVTCILPRSNTIMVDHSLPRSGLSGGLQGEPARLRAHYRFESGGEDRVAGRRTRVVVIRPRDGYRYGHRFWLDEEHGFPLRSELFTHAGEVLDRLLYASIDFVERLPEDAFRPRLTGEGFRTLRNDPPEHEISPGSQARVVIGWVPPGFLRRAHRWHGMPLSPRAVEHLLYSDGLASFSVYIEQVAAGERPGHRLLEGTATMGPVNAAGRRLDGLHVTVVGEVPAVTVERVAASVERKP